MRLGRRRFLGMLGSSAAAGVLLGRCGVLAQEAGSNGDAGSIAHDVLRPEYHLMRQHNWMNDPNGPIWWKGQYHLFYQLNPHASVWGDMHWGHAISGDMVHWQIGRASCRERG